MLLFVGLPFLLAALLVVYIYIDAQSIEPSPAPPPLPPLSLGLP